MNSNIENNEVNELANLVALTSQQFKINLDWSTLADRVLRLSDQARLEALQSLRKFHQVVEKAEASNISIYNDHQFLDLWLKDLNYEVPFDIKSYIKDDDIIEVYDHDFVQIFRNKTFYEFCSYDLLTLATTPFHVLFKRDEIINTMLFEVGQKCLTTQDGIATISTPAHTMQEHYARNSKIYEIEHKFCSPIFKAGSTERVAILCTQKATCIGESNVTGMGRFMDH